MIEFKNGNEIQMTSYSHNESDIFNLSQKEKLLYVIEQLLQEVSSLKGLIEELNHD